jgi:hypothetical protein
MKTQKGNVRSIDDRPGTLFSTSTTTSGIPGETRDERMERILCSGRASDGGWNIGTLPKPTDRAETEWERELRELDAAAQKTAN